MRRKYLHLGLLILSILFINGCASLKPNPTPNSIINPPTPDIQYSEAQDDKYLGEFVRWGGEIVKIEPVSPNKTIVTVVEKLIKENARPDYKNNNKHRASGRFIVELDPNNLNRTLSRNRFIVTYGEIIRYDELELKNETLTVPVLSSSESHIWRQPQVNNQCFVPYGYHSFGFRHQSYCPPFYLYHPRHYYLRYHHPRIN